MKRNKIILVFSLFCIFIYKYMKQSNNEGDEDANMEPWTSQGGKPGHQKQILLFQEQERSIDKKNQTRHAVAPSVIKRNLLYKIECKPVDLHAQINVIAVLQELQYQATSRANKNHWDLLWLHYAHKNVVATYFATIEEHQKMNAYPGIYLIGERYRLATQALPYMPRSFYLPNDLSAFKGVLSQKDANSNYTWLIKSIGHHGIHLWNGQSLNELARRKIMQEYVSNPFLVENYKFDIGVHVLVADLNPLRLYIFEEEVLFRLSTEPYHPFDPNVEEKFIVVNLFGQDVLLTVPKIADVYTSLGYNAKELLKHYVLQAGGSDVEIWDTFRSIIIDVFRRNLGEMIKSLQPFYESRGSFFELIRFDFILDDKLQVHLMEINQGPLLSNTEIVRHKQLKNQDVIRDTLRLVGVAEPEDYFDQVNSKADIPMPKSKCQQCSSCEELQCIACRHCLNSNKDVAHFIGSANFESKHLGGYKRLWPRPFSDQRHAEKVKERAMQHNIVTNDMILEWWQAERCLEKLHWC